MKVCNQNSLVNIDHKLLLQDYLQE